MVKHLLQLIERAHFNLNLQIEMLFLQISVTTVNSVHNATSKVNMIVFQENHIEQTDSMIAASPYLHGLLLQHAHAWCSLASVQHPSSSTFQTLHVSVGHGGNATHTLHDVQHETLGLEQRANPSAHNHGNIAFLHTASIGHEYLNLHLRIEASEYLLCNLYASKDAIFLNKQM